MITFKQSSDINQLSPNHSAYLIIKHLIELLIDEYEQHGKKYDADLMGYIVLCESGDSEKDLQQINICWHRLQDIEFDGISRINDEFFYGPYIGTDDYGLAFVIPSVLLPEELQSQVHDTITL